MLSATIINNVPDEILALPCCLWKYQMRGEDAKPSKIPLQVDKNKMAKINAPETLNIFENCKGSLTKEVGLMVAVNKESNLIVIDLDDVFDDTNKIKQSVLELLKILRPMSYCEYSPSGKGIHIWLKGSSPTVRDGFQKKCKGTLSDGSSIEVYSEHRFMTVTGKPIKWKDGGGTNGTAELMPNAQELINSVVNQFIYPVDGMELLSRFQKLRAKSSQSTDRKTDPIVTDTYTAAKKQAVKKMLATRIPSKENDGSQRLLNYAAIAKQHTLDIDDALSLVKNVIELKPLPKFYSDKDILKRIKDAACEFGDALSDVELNCISDSQSTVTIVKPPLKKVSIEQIVDDLIDDWTLDGCSRITHWSCNWWWWNCGVFRRLSDSDFESMVFKKLKEKYREVTGPSLRPIIDTIKLSLHIPDERSAPHWRGCDLAAWGAADQILATPNKMVNLPKYIQGLPDYSIDPSPQFFNLAATDYEFDPDAPRPINWYKFLDSLWGKDIEPKRLLQQIFGYLLMPTNRLQKAFLLIGPERSGKGTILKVIQKLVGERNCAALKVQLLNGEFGLSHLIDKSVALVGDARLSNASAKRRLTETLLEIVGDDVTAINQKYKEIASVRLSTRFVIAMNELPEFVDASGAVISRLVPIKFNNSFVGKENTHLLEELLPELPAIQQWAIRGYKTLMSTNRFTLPRSSLDLLEEIRTVSSPIAAFIDENCTVGKGLEVPLDELYDRFINWSDSNGFRKIDKTVFGKLLSAKGYERERVQNQGKRIRSVSGIALSTTNL